MDFHSHDSLFSQREGGNTRLLKLKSSLKNKEENGKEPMWKCRQMGYDARQERKIKGLHLPCGEPDFMIISLYLSFPSKHPVMLILTSASD